MLALLIGALCSVFVVYARDDLAAELKAAQAALAARDYDQAYPQYLHFAKEKNNALAQFTVAMFHQLGWGRPVDRAEACRWHEKAVKGAIPASTHFLAECFEHGIGRPPDPARAAVWYEKAAGLGHYVSLCALAELYTAGKGVTKDPRKGIALCQQAALKGSMSASLRLGKLLLAGDETIRDYEAAHAWFESAAHVSPEAQYYLGIMHRDGLGHPKAPIEARTWFERAASQGYVPAYFPTAELYFKSSPDFQKQRPSADDLAKAYMWLSATAKRSTDQEEQKNIQVMLEQVLAIMPPTWVATLDERVATHLAEHPASP